MFADSGRWVSWHFGEGQLCGAISRWQPSAQLSPLTQPTKPSFQPLVHSLNLPYTALSDTGGKHQRGSANAALSAAAPPSGSCV
jgi:hypothetical protein